MPYSNISIPVTLKIKFIFETSQHSDHFLDTTVSLKNDELNTDLYCKSSDSHYYLLYSSAHPRKCKESIPYNQYLWIRRFCSTRLDYDRHLKTMTLHFLDSGYLIDLLQESAIKARRLNQDSPSPIAFLF